MIPLLPTATTPEAVLAAMPPLATRNLPPPAPEVREILEGLRAVTTAACDRYFAMNGSPLSRRQYPELWAFHDGIVGSALELFGAPDGAGDVTSGGTESLFLAMKAARDWSRANRPVDGTPQVVLPGTAHLAVDKCAAMLGIEAVRVPHNRESWSVEIEPIAAAITPRTIMLLASAPSDPLAIFDPVEAFSALAVDRGLWLHVDACIGGFFTPFAAKAGYDVPPFDFRLPGVTSLSADLHKFGYAPLGVSTVLYRSGDFHRYQGYAGDKWQFEPYVSDTFRGTFPGAATAAAWAAMRYLGEDGYVTLARAVMQAKEQLAEGAARIDGVVVNEQASLNVVSYSIRGDIVPVVAEMESRGWATVGMRTYSPDAMQVYMVPSLTGIVEPYLRDLGIAAKKA